MPETNPPPFKFQPSEMTLRAQFGIEHALAGELKKLEEGGSKTQLVAPAMRDTILPLFGLFQQWVHMLVGDVLQEVAKAQSGSDDEPEMLVGIPDEELEVLQAHVLWLSEFCEQQEELVLELLKKQPKAAKASDVKKGFAEARNRLEDMDSRFESLSFDEDDEYEPLFEEEDEEEEAPKPKKAPPPEAPPLEFDEEPPAEETPDA